MGSTLVALIAFLLVGGVATAYIFGIRLPREEAAAGIQAFTAMHWREFQRLVIAAMQNRGFRLVAARHEVIDDDALIELAYETQTWLLSTKHGSRYVINPPAISGFANAMRLRGANGGWMTTLGSVAADSLALAKKQKIEVMDGQRVWSEIKPILEPEARTAIAGTARVRANRHLLVAWGVAVVMGGALLLLGRTGGDASLADNPAAATPVPVSGAPAPRAAEEPAQPAEAAPTPVPEDPEELAARRKKLVSAMSTLPWIAHANWVSPSSLTVQLAGDGEIDRRALCKLVEPYAELRATRLQLQPPEGSTRTVRFMQCFAY